MDHFFQLPPLGGPGQPMLEAYTLLGALAARTRRVQLGTLVTGVTYRNPGILAKIVTTLDVISRGRAILGIGGAWYDVEHQGLGIDYPGDRVRLDMLDEAVQVCRAMFTGDDVSFTGRHYRLDHARNLPRPVQAGGPKIMIGGGGEKRTLRLVARYADQCNVTGDVATLARKIGVLRRHCAEAGRDPAEVGVTWMTPLVLTTSSQNTAEVRQMLAAAGSAEQIAGFTVGQPHEIPGLVAGHIEAGADEVISASPSPIRRNHCGGAGIRPGRTVAALAGAAAKVSTLLPVPSGPPSPPDGQRLIPGWLPWHTRCASAGSPASRSHRADGHAERWLWRPGARYSQRPRTRWNADHSGARAVCGRVSTPADGRMRRREDS
jgi:F420-dependent oxidoreductase-like protein